MENEKALVYNGVRIGENHSKFFSYSTHSGTLLKVISLDGYKRNNIYASLFNTVDSWHIHSHSLLANPLCIANKDLVINQYLLKKMENQRYSYSKENYSFSIYGNATINEELTCDLLFVNGDLTINATHLTVSCLLVTGKLIANNSHLTLGNFYVGELIAKSISFKESLIFGQHCVVAGNCLLDSFNCRIKQIPNSDYLTFSCGDFKCKKLDLTGALEIYGSGKIENLTKNQTRIYAEEDLEVDSSIDLEAELDLPSIVCRNLIAHSSVNVGGEIRCSGDFKAHGNVNADEISVDGNYTVTNDGVTKAKKIKIRGSIHAKEIDSFDLKTYRHVFDN